MAIHELAGKPAPKSMLINIRDLISSYYTEEPSGPVSFGTSGHRGSSGKGTFNEMHIAAIAQAISDYRSLKGIKGPLFMGYDTHALSKPAFRTALEVFAANEIETVIHDHDGYTPTPVISFFILEHNRHDKSNISDGVVITPSHNPPGDGGIKYNPPHGGPADIDVTRWVEDRANNLMKAKFQGIKRIDYQKARSASSTHERDMITPFVHSLSHVIDMEAIRRKSIHIGADPMGGSGINFWEPIAEEYGLNIEIVNKRIDPTFGFMSVDHDGQIRMDCSSPYSMASLIAMADKFDIAWGNDPDFDRHGIVCKDGLMNPNHYLSVAIWYLLGNRPSWEKDLRIGKTLVSSSIIDRIVESLGKDLFEVPVGFKWFVSGLLDGSVAFGGEESAGAAFLRMDGTAWSTDKDGFSMGLLAAEILAKTGKTPSDIYRNILVPLYGEPYYKRIDGPITDKQKKRLKNLNPESIKRDSIAGLSIRSVITRAPGNGAPIGGVKVLLEDGSWFAVRPSGTEPKMKVYVESFGGEALWQKVYDQALSLIFGEI
ncbi:MAG: alpha-D-glucose phosphate-specific phosphoglucomutase [Deltaproteobacteria bacterium]|nr:alpha-D-glucose phosphate-specific phosphoglucomutase [Deltaproteobacteria bacterium]